MDVSAVVAGPRPLEGNTQLVPKRHDVGFGLIDEGRQYLDMGGPLHGQALHGLKGAYEGRPAVRIDWVIPGMDREGDRLGAPAAGPRAGDGEHDRVTVGDHR